MIIFGIEVRKAPKASVEKPKTYAQGYNQGLVDGAEGYRRSNESQIRDLQYQYQCLAEERKNLENTKASYVLEQLRYMGR